MVNLFRIAGTYNTRAMSRPLWSAQKTIA